MDFAVLVDTGLSRPAGYAEAHAAMVTLRAKAGVCELTRAGELRFIGDTDGLDACLNSIGSAKITTLSLTSGGGDVAKALPVARRVAGLKLKLKIIGVCASSCANYIVPVAATIEIMPYSIIALHGGMDKHFLSTAEAQLRASLAASDPAPSPEETDMIVNSELSKLKDLLDDQEKFKDEYGVSSDWFELNAYKNFEMKDGSGKTPMVAVSESFFKKNLKVNLSRSSWWMKNQTDYNLVSSLFEKSFIIYDGNP
ncbi:hypothetical protein AEAC466_19905 [Asticcacaulis sp. AC466]|uniref:hypothetical protein n=1 Tax=Asticcacaulis sp. AC466 TaxID=1282362 RepID=UPI0003C3FD0A|nr:hypothetical protein [Asticcacaulis sp. AC466]ESQ81830.1 hypothetical protein AEAC466_19905 [Asticcacaulis sp. AC466]